MSVETGAGEAPQITYVGGKAIEQTESLGSDMPTDEREAAKEAVRKAIKAAAEEAGETAAKEAKEDRGKDPFKPPGTKKSTESSKVESDGEDDSKGGPARGPDGKFLPKGEPGLAKGTKSGGGGDTDSGDEEFDPTTASVKQLLKNREKLANQKKEFKDELAKEREAFQQQVRQFQEQQAQLQQYHRQLQAERQALAALKKDPARAVREAGWDPEQFILDLAQEGTPEGKAKREAAELRAQLQELQNWKAQQAKQAEEQQYRHYMQQAEAHRNHMVTSFLKLGQDEERYPHVANFYAGRDKLLVAAGDLIAEEFRNLSGREGSLEQILDYLEDELADSANKWYQKSNKGKSGQQVRQDTVEEKKGTPPKSKGKSLTPEAASERRAGAAKDLMDLDQDERIEAAKAAVKSALAASQRD